MLSGEDGVHVTEDTGVVVSECDLAIKGRYHMPIPSPLRLPAVLVIVSVAVGCQGDSLASPTYDGSDPPGNVSNTDREALAIFYNRTDGDNWTDNAGWLMHGWRQLDRQRWVANVR